MRGGGNSGEMASMEPRWLHGMGQGACGMYFFCGGGGEGGMLMGIHACGRYARVWRYSCMGVKGWIGLGYLNCMHRCDGVSGR